MKIDGVAFMSNKNVFERIKNSCNKPNKTMKIQKNFTKEELCVKDIESRRKSMEDSIRIQRIAKKIARGEKVSPQDIQFLREKSPEKLAKAIMANEERKMTETQIRAAKDKKEVERILVDAKTQISAGAKQDPDFTELRFEGSNQLEEKYLRGKKKNRSDEIISNSVKGEANGHKRVVKTINSKA